MRYIVTYDKRSDGNCDFGNNRQLWIENSSLILDSMFAVQEFIIGIFSSTVKGQILKPLKDGGYGYTLGYTDIEFIKNIVIHSLTDSEQITNQTIDDCYKIIAARKMEEYLKLKKELGV